MNKQQLINELKKEGFSNLILKAFQKVKREKFIPKHLKPYAYRNEPLSIGEGSTISQPYTIAFMLNLLELNKLSGLTKNINDKLLSNIIKENIINNKEKLSEQENLGKKYEKVDFTNKEDKIKILEIGSGSGYVLALISEILKIKNLKLYY